jgi:sulfatase maturation enzyme AslB (radical SAM superfamily)
MSRELPRPIPAAGVLAYEAEREARLNFSPECRANWERYLEANRSQAVVDYLPVKLDVENVSRCNFACSMCAVSTWPKGKRARDMTLDEFKSLIDEQVGLIEIKLNGLGEALLQGDDYFEMVAYARARRIWVRMTTNASLLHLRLNARKLVESGVNEIDISIDGADAPTFEGIRIQSDFDRVAKNCALLNHELKMSGKPSAKAWTLVQKANYKNLPAHVKLAASLGFRHMVFSTQLHGWGNDKLAERNRSEMVSLSQDELWGLVELGNNLGVRVSFWDVSEKFEAKPGKRCTWPFERAVVTSDSRTVICCMVGDPDQHEIGKGKTFLENWSGAEYAAFRKAHLDGRIPDVCKACYK